MARKARRQSDWPEPAAREASLLSAFFSGYQPDSALILSIASELARACGYEDEMMHDVNFIRWLLPRLAPKVVGMKADSENDCAGLP
jgi:hypothetical protein